MDRHVTHFIKQHDQMEDCFLKVLERCPISLITIEMQKKYCYKSTKMAKSGYMSGSWTHVWMSDGPLILHTKCVEYSKEMCLHVLWKADISMFIEALFSIAAKLESTQICSTLKWMKTLHYLYMEIQKSKPLCIQHGWVSETPCGASKQTWSKYCLIPLYTVETSHTDQKY